MFSAVSEDLSIREAPTLIGPLKADVESVARPQVNATLQPGTGMNARYLRAPACNLPPLKYSGVMSDIERRALLGAAGVIGVAALSKISQAGPLTPPAGAVAPSGRTLTEIYDKIPAGLPNGTGDGRTPIAGASSTVIISLPGSYVLTGNIITAGACILINSSDVTLDLNGYTLNCTNTISNVLAIATTRTRIAIRNGRIVGGAEGISVNTPTSVVADLLLEDLSIYNPKQAGIGLNYVGVDRVLVRRCSVLNPGSTSAAGDTRGVRGISIGGGGNRVEACTVAGLIDNGTVGTTLPRGISLTGTSDASAGNVVAGCTVSAKVSITGEGIRFFGFGTYRDNTVLGFSTFYNGGLSATNGGGNT